MVDRRRYVRIPVIINIEVFSGTETHKGVIVNVGAGGLGLLLTKTFECGTEIILSFKLNNKILEKIKGSIVRSEMFGDQFYSFIGINFKGLDEFKRVEINKFVLDRKLEQYGFKPK